MPVTGFTCIRCGHCCRNLVDAYRGCVSDADLVRWREAGREDVLAFVETLDLGHGNLLHTAWVDPVTGDDVEACPWLAELPDGTSYACGIESVKPDHCRAYPEHRSHGLQTGCRGFSPQHSRTSVGKASSVGSTAPCDRER
jgi:Fe-S-cluster containining protein